MTNRPFGFRKRIQVDSEEPLLPSKHTEQLQSVEAIELLRGRRTGLVIKPSNQRDEHGMERLSDFWTAEIITTGCSDETICDEAKDVSKVQSQNTSVSESEGNDLDSSVLSDSFASSRSNKCPINLSGSATGTEQPNSSYEMSDLSGVDPAKLNITKESHRTSCSSMISEVRLSTATGRSSISNVEDDEESERVEESEFSPVSNKDGDQSHTTDADDQKHDDQEEQESSVQIDPVNDEDDVSAEASISPKSIVLNAASKVETPASVSDASSSAKYQSPDPDATKKLNFADPNSASPKGRGSSVLGTIAEPDVDAETNAPECGGCDDNQSDGNDDIDEQEQPDGAEPICSEGDISLENRPTTKKVRVKKNGTKGLGGLQAMGRASYCSTDSYAVKSSRLSLIAPRPLVAGNDDGSVRQSSRRKIPPLQYWRNERVEYARAQGAAVPEIVDLIVRSPEPTPNWVRRRREGKGGQDNVVPESIAPSAAAENDGGAGKKKAAAVKAKRVRVQDSAEHQGEGAKRSRGASKKRDASAGDAAADEAAERPSAPKRVSPFFAFCAERRSDVIASRPDLDVTGQAYSCFPFPRLPPPLPTCICLFSVFDLYCHVCWQARLLGEMWRALPAVEKQAYRDICQSSEAPVTA